jgi:hypothetical protein
MTMTWDRWEAMRAELDYCLLRMGELERAGTVDRAEFEALVAHGLQTAARLLHLPDAPPLSNAKVREQWQTGCASVRQTREKIVEASRALQD